MEQRIKIILAIFIGLLGGLVSKAFFVQVLHADTILARSSVRFDHSVAISPNRGLIQDRRGEPLAISINVKSIHANPKAIKNDYATATKLAKVLKVNRNELSRQLKTGKHFIWVKRQISPDQAEAVKKLDIKGVGFVDDKKRFYPESDAMANVLGLVNIDGKGLEGLELKYDKKLKGTPLRIEVEKDGHGRIIYAQGLKPEKNEIKDGHSLGLTIDRRMQYIAYESLKSAIIKNNARSGFIVMSNPYTGEIYANASFPSFNPNAPTRRSLSGHKNRSITDMFEPGSVVKPMWVAWGLDNKLLKHNQMVFCENGAYKYYHTEFNDHDGYGYLSLPEVIKYSSNIGMVKLFAPFNAEKMFEGMKTMGFGTRTGIDFPGEARGLIRPPERWRHVDKATLSFGQGFAATGVQLITAFNAIVNGGMLVKPHIVKTITDPKGNVTHIRPTIIRKVFSEKTSKEIVDIMKTVVLKGGTAEAAHMNDYIIFGKTGTAQKIDPLTRTYARDAHTTTFMGGVIDATGKLVMTMIVCIDEPHPRYYASEVACPLFKAVTAQCASIMDMRPIITLAKAETD